MFKPMISVGHQGADRGMDHLVHAVWQEDRTVWEEVESMVLAKWATCCGHVERAGTHNLPFLGRSISIFPCVCVHVCVHHTHTCNDTQPVPHSSGPTQLHICLWRRLPFLPFLPTLRKQPKIAGDDLES